MSRLPSALALLLSTFPAIISGLDPELAAPYEPERRECERLNESGSYADALPHCRRAAALLRATGARGIMAAEKGELGRSLNSLGLALEMTGDRRAAEASYREALALHRSLGKHEQEALVLSNLAALAIGGGDYGGALAWLSAEEAVAQSALASGDEPWAAAEQKYVRMNRSVALEQLGAYAEALDQLRPLTKEIRSDGGRDVGDPSADAALAVNLAVLYRNLGDPRRALTLLERARLTYERLDDRSALANVHLNRGLVHQLNLHAPATAEVELARALELAYASGDRGEEIRTLCALGDLRLRDRRLAEARAAFERARAAAITSEAASGRWAAEAGLGRVARDAGDPDAALVHLRAAIAEIEKTGEGIGDSALRGGLLSDQRAVYATAVDLLAERALAGTAVSGRANVSEASDGSHGSYPAALEALALAEQAKARELLDALAGGGSGAPLHAAELAALIPRLGPTLAYFFGERHLWRWEIQGDSWHLAEAGEPIEIATIVARIHRRLARAEPAAVEDLARLGRSLLPGRMPSSSELRIAPDGRLFYLPFDLLPDPDRPQATLLERVAVSYLPSLAVFARLRSVPETARWRFAALAAPELPATPATGSLAALLARRFGLPPLPGAEREARDAATRLGEPSSVEVGSAATEQRLRELAAEGAQVLHIAAHTVVDESLAGGVALFLAPGAGESIGARSSATAGETDGLVSAAELSHLPLTADLAVLSGCRTALADSSASAGDGAGGGRALASLSGALLGAGARGVVASLWEVGDAGTAALMEQFYFELARGRRPAMALRTAKLRLARDPRWAQAPRWAGFVLLGDPGPIVRPRSSGLGLAAALAAILAGGAILLRDLRRRRRRKRDEI